MDTTRPENKVILVVEDELSLARALVEKLFKEGFSVIEARNGEEGLQVALREHPDLILLDIVMPKMDGITMLTKLREDSWGKGARVVILTNLSDDLSVDKSIQYGAFDYLVKTDWKIEEVIEKIRARLGLQ